MARDILNWTLMALLALVMFASAVPVVLLSFGYLRGPLMDRLVRLWGRAGLWLTRVEVEVVGREHLLSPRPRVVLINHSSSLDMLIMGLVSPCRMMMVAKSSLRWFFPFNIAFALLGVVYVDRNTRGGSVEAMRRAAQLVRTRNRSLTLSPEGTRSRTGKLGAFKSGAFHVAQQAEAEIVSVVIHGAFDLCPSDSWRVKPGRVRVDVKPPLPPPRSDEDPRRHAETFHKRYLTWLDDL